MSVRNVKPLLWTLCIVLVSTASCTGSPTADESTSGDGHPAEESNILTLPDIGQARERTGPIRVVATTSIIGDVVSAIGGDSVDVEVLMEANEDPHGYQSTAGDMRLVANADVVFVNGWDLEEGLISNLQNAAGETPIVPISAGIEPRLFEDDSNDGESHAVDSHVWLAPANVVYWVDNVEFVLSTLDPANSEGYLSRADAYRAQLEELAAYYDGRLESVDTGRRLLVTNHDAFGYLADAYGLEVLGTIVHGDSTLAEPSSRDLATLVERMNDAGVCAIFVERSASQDLARQLAEELDHCQEVQIVALYSGALGEVGSGAETYLQMMSANLDAIINALTDGSTATTSD